MLGPVGFKSNGSLQLRQRLRIMFPQQRDIAQVHVRSGEGAIQGNRSLRCRQRLLQYPRVLTQLKSPLLDIGASYTRRAKTGFALPRCFGPCPNVARSDLERLSIQQVLFREGVIPPKSRGARPCALLDLWDLQNGGKSAGFPLEIKAF